MSVIYTKSAVYALLLALFAVSLYKAIKIIVLKRKENEYTGAVKPLFREIGNRQSGRWKPIVRNRVPPFISYLQSVYSLNAGSNP